MKITTQQRKACAEIADRFNLQLLFVFGSFARGDMHPESDLDIGYVRKESRDFSFNEHCNFTDAIQRTFPFKVDSIDAVNIRTAPPLLAYCIVTDGQKLYGKKLDEEKLFLRVAKEYIDAAPLFQQTSLYVDEKLSHI